MASTACRNGIVREGNSKSSSFKSRPHPSPSLGLAVRRSISASSVGNDGGQFHLFFFFYLIFVSINNWNSDTYEFDEVFTESASQKRVCEVVAKPVVEVCYGCFKMVAIFLLGYIMPCVEISEEKFATGLSNFIVFPFAESMSFPLQSHTSLKMLNFCKLLIFIFLVSAVSLSSSSNAGSECSQADCLKVPASSFISSLKTTVDAIQQVVPVISKFANLFDDFRLTNAISDCLDLLDFSADELSWSISASQNPAGKPLVKLQIVILI
ncbi:hypothetical protein WN944_010795 [Citrus x changshan-huyou]|uniref:Pectinesterase inhibitor domain-containing protein n=1 Tax=Citrus x changshan-huyou TaxID=2935761 RepID=A0AAP0MSB0_9ROSI